jgi:PAS domain S-box-containing protein
MVDHHAKPLREVQKPRDRLLSDISARLVLRGAAAERESADQLLESVFAEVARHLDVEYYFNFHVVENDPGGLRLVSCMGAEGSALAALRTIRFGDYLCGVVAQTRQPLVLADLPHSGLPNADAMCAMGATAYAGYPMLAGERLIGTISFATGRRARFESAELDLIQTVADLLAAAVERDRLAATLSEREARLRETLEALRVSERRFRDFADAAPAMLWVTDSTGYCNYLSQGWYTFTGQREDEGHGWGWTAAIHPDDQEAAAASFKAANEERVECLIDFRLRRADGTYRWVIDAGRPHFDADGVFCGFVGSVFDIDDRKRAEGQLQASEERFRAAIAATSELLWTNDADGRMTGEQPGWAGFTGQSIEEYQGLGWAKAVHPDDAAPTVKAWEQAVAERRMFVWEHRLRRHDGHYRLCAIRAVPVVNPDGSVREWVGVHTDIQDQRAAEDAMRDADRRKDEFLATLAHELRNPLAPILTGLQIMRLSPNPGHASSARDMMERQVAQMVRLIDDLLDVSRISSGKIELRKERLDLRSVIDAALETSRPLVDAARHELLVRLPEHPVWIDADVTRLAQVVSNLVNNAVKYTPDGGRIVLSGHLEANEAVIVVTDAGVGIPSEMISKVFDMFAQVNRTLSRSQGGLGIGLNLVKRLVELHGGTVEARSDGLTRGSTFTVRLPVADRPTSDMSPARAADIQVPAARKRVLIVDDNVDGAVSLATLLGLMGHETHTVHDGPAALVAVQHYQPAAVLLDLGLPGLTGYEVARQLRENPSLDATTLIALTGWGSDGDKLRTRASGFDFHLTKPVEVKELEKVLAAKAGD